jgi:hypothetical protein
MVPTLTCGLVRSNFSFAIFPSSRGPPGPASNFYVLPASVVLEELLVLGSELGACFFHLEEVKLLDLRLIGDAQRAI